ncbi:unnamed protein product [Prorocentrum cordatum]|uniref:Uncharacterized protein n=1 Tax=Prorocentrum cordatum TaxID=2364126 RepID=A0ABN9WKS1_9DINO|nr:unnamed protein product [Polarella glacialis]
MIVSHFSAGKTRRRRRKEGEEEEEEEEEEDRLRLSDLSAKGAARSSTPPLLPQLGRCRATGRPHAARPRGARRASAPAGRVLPQAASGILRGCPPRGGAL